MDELLDGMTEALLRGQWQSLDASEARRMALLPQTPVPEWDALMVQPSYMQALI